MIFLWTDCIYWFLLAAWVVIMIAPKPRHVELAWESVGKSRLAMSCFVILICYLLIALLDCIHFRQVGSNDIISILDMIMSPLNHIQETTYSPPFSNASVNYVNKTLSFGLVVFKALAISVGLAFFASIGVFVLARRLHQCKTIATTLFACVFVLSCLYILSRHYHIMGTDKVGQDVFYQSIKSIRTGVLIGTLTTMVMFPFAIFFGTIAGYFRGWVDDIVQYVYTTLSSIPGVLLIVAFMLMLEIIMGRYPELFENILMRADFRLLALCIIFGITSWTSLCRLLRAETLKLREQDYVRAGVVLGSSNAAILKRHIVPNLMHIVFITMAMEFSSLVLAEAVLAYVGVGVDPSTFSWGNMINSARLELARDPIVWWSLFSAFVFMFILVLAANLFADVVQKAFNPRARSIN